MSLVNTPDERVENFLLFSVNRNRFLSDKIDCKRNERKYCNENKSKTPIYHKGNNDTANQSERSLYANTQHTRHK